MNHKNARILKLHRQGLSIGQIIMKIGHQPSPEITARIEKVIAPDREQAVLANEVIAEIIAEEKETK